PLEMATRIARLVERAQRAVAGGTAQQAQEDYFQIPNPRIIAAAFADFASHALANPGRLIAAQFELWHDHLMLWSTFWRKIDGHVVEPIIAPPRDDRRFADSWWNEHPVF